MAYSDDVAAQRAKVEALRKQLAEEEARLAQMEAQLVRGGPDVSEWQGDITWTEVKKASDYAFVRVADGNYQDKLFSKARVDALRAAGITLGTYYFARVAAPSNGERNGKSEAAMAVYFAEDKGALKPGDLPLAYDFEDLNGQTAAKAANHLMEFVNTYRYIKGHWPILYTMPAMWTQVSPHISAENQTRLANCPLWIAHWGVSKPTVPAPWNGNWTWWQYTDAGSHPGITGKVDLNHFSGSKTDLSALLIK